MELYTVSSLLKAYRGKKDVRVHWQARTRTKPICDYRTLIRDYDYLSESDKRSTEEDVDCLFTEAECETLVNYLHNECGLQADIELAGITPVGVYVMDNYDEMWFQEAEVLKLEQNPIPGATVVGYYLVDPCDPVPALIDMLAEHSLENIPRSASGDADTDRARQFFSALGELTGIYFREDNGRIRAILGDEPPFTGGLRELMHAIEAKIKQFA